MAKRSCGDLFVISGKCLGVFLEIFRKPGVFLKICGPQVDFAERQGANCKIGGDFLVSDLFSNGKLPCTQPMAHDPRVELVHGGHKIEAAVVAHRSSCSRSVRSTAAHRKVGKTKKSSPGFGSALHQSLYGTEEVARWRWSFSLGWRQHERDEDQEEESWRGGDLHRGQGDLL
jgi:hypothetical protein